MEITIENLDKAVVALRKCAKENEGKPTDTGNVVVANLCTDVADFLEEQYDAKHKRWMTDVKIECICHRCRLDKRKYTSAEERSHICQKGLFLDLIDTRMVETHEINDTDDKEGNIVFVESEMFIGVKKGIDIDKELAHEEY